MPDKIQNSSSRWPSETISAQYVIYHVTYWILLWRDVRFDLKSLDFAIRLTKKKSVFSKTLQQDPFQWHEPWTQKFSLSDFDENHSWVEIYRSDGINSARGGQALIFDANILSYSSSAFTITSTTTTPKWKRSLGVSFFPAVGLI